MNGGSRDLEVYLRSIRSKTFFLVNFNCHCSLTFCSLFRIAWRSSIEKELSTWLSTAAVLSCPQQLTSPGLGEKKKKKKKKQAR